MWVVRGRGPKGKIGIFFKTFSTYGTKQAVLYLGVCGCRAPGNKAEGEAETSTLFRSILLGIFLTGYHGSTKNGTQPSSSGL
eukprot:scaffold20872_cov115-Skeletonema_marinoi.AAC.1